MNNMDSPFRLKLDPEAGRPEEPLNEEGDFLFRLMRGIREFNLYGSLPTTPDREAARAAIVENILSFAGMTREEFKAMYYKLAELKGEKTISPDALRNGPI